MIKVELTKGFPVEAVPNIGTNELKTILGNVATSARNHWIRLAAQDSSVFRNDYIRGITPVVNEGKTKHVIRLVGEVPHMLEDGAPKLDMRDTLLGPNVPVRPLGQKGKRLGKNKQFYRAIPLRHTTPGSTKNIGQAMGSAYKGNDAVMDAKKLGSAVYRAAKALTPTTTNPYGKTGWGGRLNTSRLRGGLAPGSSGVPLLKPHHKSSIYEGMVRQEKTYEKATQSQYTTFRTISTGVRDESWWRKAFAARRYAAKVQDFVGKILPKAFEAFMEG